MPRSKKAACTIECNTRKASVEESVSLSGQNVEEILRMLVDDQRRRDEEFVEERHRWEEDLAAEREWYEKEVEARMAEMMEQMVMLSQLVTQSGLFSGEMTAVVNSKLKVATLTDHDDIEAFPVIFERSMKAYEVPKTRPTYKLDTQLSGRAQQAYAAMPSEISRDYDEVGLAILRQYDIAGGTYQQRFRAASNWTRGCDSVEEFQKKLLPLEEKCSTGEKGCLEVKINVETFRTYLHRRNFAVEADHGVWEWFERTKDSPRFTRWNLTRWSLSLQPYQSTIKHQPEVANGIADALDWFDKGPLSQERKEGVSRT